jgi:hypothetical protein
MSAASMALSLSDAMLGESALATCVVIIRVIARAISNPIFVRVIG